MSSSSIVLRIPYGSTAFQDALQALQKPFPTATYRERQDILARVREWTDITLALEDAAYIPLRTEWMPPRERRTADGVELLLAGRWPAEVQQAIEARRTTIASVATMTTIWEGMQNATKSINGPPLDGDSPAEAAVAAEEGVPTSDGAAPEQCPVPAQTEAEAGRSGLNDDAQSEAPAVEPGVQSVLSPASVSSPDRDVAVSVEVCPVIPDEEIDRLEPGSDEFTQVVRRMEHYGAKFPPWVFDQPTQAVREGLKRAARAEKVVAAYRREQVAEAKRKEETKYDRFYAIGKKGAVVLLYSEIGAHLREKFCALTFNKTLYLFDEATGLYVENVGQVESAVQEIAETVGYGGRITQAKREALSYVKDYNVVTEYPFNAYPGIPVANGVVHVDLATGEIRLEPYSPEMRFTYRLPVVYDPAASPDLIDQVLRQWVEPDDVPLLYQVPAQAILHQIGRKKPYKKCYLLHGDQDAGKTTYLELLYCTFGVENCAGVALQRIGLDRFYKGALEGKVFNTYDDLSDVPFDNTGALKALTGGFEHDIERKGRDSYKGRIFAVHVFTCNKPPSVDERNRTDSAFWSRWEYVTFPNSFPRDPAFHDRTFTQEAISGFFNRVLETVVAIAQNGALLVDSSAFVVRDRWSFNSDPLYRFIQSNLEKDPKGAIPKDDLYDAYLKFCAFEQVDAAKIPASKDAFAKKLFGYDFGTSKQTVEGKRVQMFTGYAWQVSSQFKPGGTNQAKFGGA